MSVFGTYKESESMYYADNDGLTKVQSYIQRGGGRGSLRELEGRLRVDDNRESALQPEASKYGCFILIQRDVPQSMLVDKIRRLAHICRPDGLA